MELHVIIDDIGMNAETKIRRNKDDLLVEMEGDYQLGHLTSEFISNVGTKGLQNEKVRLKIDGHNIDRELYVGALHFDFGKDTLHFEGAFASDYGLLV